MVPRGPARSFLSAPPIRHKKLDVDICLLPFLWLVHDECHECAKPKANQNQRNLQHRLLPDPHRGQVFLKKLENTIVQPDIN